MDVRSIGQGIVKAQLEKGRVPVRVIFSEEVKEMEVQAIVDKHGEHVRQMIGRGELFVELDLNGLNIRAVFSDEVKGTNQAICEYVPLSKYEFGSEDQSKNVERKKIVFMTNPQPC